VSILPLPGGHVCHIRRQPKRVEQRKLEGKKEGWNFGTELNKVEASLGRTTNDDMCQHYRKCLDNEKSVTSDADMDASLIGII
jgi:hypothetical protein